ncbi:MAG: DUF2953 domain-containing protein [Candidatus Syntrophonatronum acetioxidans]|uniref:DUF2953 domain-containing protein n=1 Tax=Candidatus Syntrophonatronum acetioxidans TaxID=1795816 RepID=A0A424YFL4_9FIRM|nr:MAG: DUF2953 domain-containing protein [Candidatus Syntrophonatronum acetioxidans]
MSELLYFLPVILIVFLAFNLLPVGIKIRYLRENKDNYLRIEIVALWGLIKLKPGIPVKDVFDTEDVENKIKEKCHIYFFSYLKGLKKVRKNLQRPGGFFKLFKRHIKCSHFYWSTSFGLSDAGETGIFYGIIWAAKGNTAALLKKVIFFKDSSFFFQVNPDFKKPHLRVDIQGFFSLYLYHLYFIMALIIYLKLQGGERPKWKTTQSRA